MFIGLSGTSLYINQAAFPLNNAQNGLNPSNSHPTFKTPDFFPQTNGVNDLTQNLQQMSFNHSNSNPDLHQVCSSPPEMHHTSSYPYNINKVGLTSAHNPNQLSNHSSINDQLKTSPQENIFKNNFRRFSDISIPGKVSDPSTIFSQLGTPTMLKSSHLQTETENSSQHSDPKYSGFVNCDKPSRISPIGGYQTPPIAEYLVEHSTMSPVPLGQPPQQCNGFVASSSASNVQRSNCVGPPPTAGYYIQNEKGSPNRSSPVSLRARSPMLIANVSIENDNELLESTIKNLQECREKCLCHLNSRNSEEISKKIITFQQTWSSGKLSAAVKLQMSELASGKWFISCFIFYAQNFCFIKLITF